MISSPFSVLGKNPPIVLNIAYDDFDGGGHFATFIASPDGKPVAAVVQRSASLDARWRFLRVVIATTLRLNAKNVKEGFDAAQGVARMYDSSAAPLDLQFTQCLGIAQRMADRDLVKALNDLGVAVYAADFPSFSHLLTSVLAHVHDAAHIRLVGTDAAERGMNVLTFQRVDGGCFKVPDGSFDTELKVKLSPLIALSNVAHDRLVSLLRASTAPNTVGITTAHEEDTSATVH